MELNILLVDDLETDRQLLTDCIEAFFEGRSKDTIHIDCYTSAEEALPAFKAGAYQMAFLDICMDEMNGIELARQIRAQDKDLLIVFQTTSREYAFDAFPIHPFDYLIKPCTPDAMQHVLDEALRVLASEEPEIAVTAARDSYHLQLRRICSACSVGRGVDLALENGKVIRSVETFREIQEKLSGDPRFLLINRGILVNMDHVLAPAKDAMKMKDGSLLPIRVNGRAAVLSAFSQYMISRMNQG